MVPHDLTGYFTASSAVAGTLLGLLFVAITLRYEEIVGSGAMNNLRTAASSAFTALTNAPISLLALLPGIDLGYPAAVLAVISLLFTLRTHVGRGTSRRLFATAVLVYAYQLVSGAVLIADKHAHALVYGLAYTAFAAFVTGLARSWTLLQPDRTASSAATSSPGLEVEA